MQKQRALEMLAGVKSRENTQASAPTNVHVISGEVGAASENGKVPIRIDGLVFGPDDTQYVDVDTLGGLKEGDTAMMLLTGEPGHGMTPFAIGTPGSVDMAASTATSYLTESDESGLLVHRSTDTDVSTINGVHIDEDVDILRNGESVANYGEVARIGRADGKNVVIDSNGFNFKDADELKAAMLSSSSGVEDVRLYLNVGPKDSETGFSSNYVVDYLGRYTAADGMASSGVEVRYSDDDDYRQTQIFARSSKYVSQLYATSEDVVLVPMDSDSNDLGIYNASLENLANLIACRAYLAGGDITVPANGGASATWNWQGPHIVGSGGGNAASFPDTNYVVSLSKSGNGVVNGFNNVDFMVTGKTVDTVTVYGWNSNSYPVTLHVTCIGFNSRYGTRV